MTVLNEKVLSKKRVDGFTVIEKEVTRTETEIVYRGVTLPNDFDSLLHDLRSADGCFDRVVIYDRAVAGLLEKLKCAHRNARGSYGGNREKIDKLAEKYRKVLYEHVWKR